MKLPRPEEIGITTLSQLEKRQYDESIERIAYQIRAFKETLERYGDVNVQMAPDGERPTRAVFQAIVDELVRQGWTYDYVTPNVLRIRPVYRTPQTRSL